MTKLGIATLRQAARRLRDRFRPAPLILLYHRVADLPSDPQLLCVTPEHFKEHVEILRNNACPMALGEMVRALRDNTLPRRAVAVTFDDGYADNLLNGKPSLERYEVPATVYVISGFVDARREFWADQLEQLFLQPGILPQQLCLTISGQTYRWDLGERAHYSEDEFKQNRAWHVLKTENPTPRHQVYRALCQLLYTLPHRDQHIVLGSLNKWAGTKPVCRPTHRALTPDEVRLLAQDGLVEVGSHTVEHPSLSALSVAGQRDEIRRSKIRLEEIVGHPVTSFAYPYGTRSDYTAETVEIVREAGYDHACSNFEGLVRQGTDPCQLPRYLVRDWDGEEFERHLMEWRDA
ncbi:MAG: polysaccharide deacetylase family protein [Nitrospirae bacterium]|nr:polysaccharide deacetylase family protein [Nitrospirota bacterium]MDE3041924.1 polysaccharide deacetylase family protein [Nitrospirota bacterium]